jgi:hypothetical protein
LKALRLEDMKNKRKKYGEREREREESAKLFKMSENYVLMLMRVSRPTHRC